jgi:hypothetical protein
MSDHFKYIKTKDRWFIQGFFVLGLFKSDNIVYTIFLAL